MDNWNSIKYITNILEDKTNENVDPGLYYGK